MTAQRIRPLWPAERRAAAARARNNANALALVSVVLGFASLPVAEHVPGAALALFAAACAVLALATRMGAAANALDVPMPRTRRNVQRAPY